MLMMDRLRVLCAEFGRRVQQARSTAEISAAVAINASVQLVVTLLLPLLSGPDVKQLLRHAGDGAGAAGRLMSDFQQLCQDALVSLDAALRMAGVGTTAAGAGGGGARGVPSTDVRRLCLFCNYLLDSFSPTASVGSGSGSSSGGFLFSLFQDCRTVCCHVLLALQPVALLGGDGDSQECVRRSFDLAARETVSGGGGGGGSVLLFARGVMESFRCAPELLLPQLREFIARHGHEFVPDQGTTCAEYCLKCVRGYALKLLG